MHANQRRRLKKECVQIEDHAVLRIVQKPQRRDGAGMQPEKLQHVAFRCEREPFRTVSAAEFPQIDAPVAAHGEKVVITLVVVPDEEVFCIGRRIGKRYGCKICHIVSRRVLGYLMPDAFFVQQTVNGLLVQHDYPPVMGTGNRRSGFPFDLFSDAQPVMMRRAPM